MAEQYITPTGLKGKRGWTDAMIQRLLGEPDRYADNPHYKSGPQMKLYAVERVKAAENSGRFARHVPDARRKKAAAKAVRTKIHRLTRWAESVHLRYDFPESVKLRGSDRQKVNYLRHECTAYDDALGYTHGVTGRHYVYPIIKNRILNEIARRFPELAQEARLQAIQIDAGTNHSVAHAETPKSGVLPQILPLQ